MFEVQRESSLAHVGAQFAFAIGAAGLSVQEGLVGYLLFVALRVSAGSTQADIIAIYILSSVAGYAAAVLVGLISDNWASRMGRRFPFMFIGAFGAALATYSSFAASAKFGLSAALPIMAALLFSRLFSALFEVPSLALMVEATQDYGERTGYLSWWYGARFAVLALTGPVFYSLGSSFGVLALGVLAVIVTLGPMLFSIFVLRYEIGDVSVPHTGSRVWSGHLGSALEALTARPLVILLIAMAMVAASQGMVFTLSQVLERSLGQATTGATFSEITRIIAAIAVVFLLAWFRGVDKRRAVALFGAGLIAALILLVVPGLAAHLLDADAPMAFVVIGIAEQALYVLLGAFFMSMLFDTVEYVALIVGRRLEGTLIGLLVGIEGCALLLGREFGSELYTQLGSPMPLAVLSIILVAVALFLVQWNPIDAEEHGREIARLDRLLRYGHL